MTEAPSTQVVRHTLADRLLHWSNAVLWAALLITGIGMLEHPVLAPLGMDLPRWLRELFGGSGGLLTVHIWLGVCWLVALGLYLVLRWRGAAFFLRQIVTYQASDLTWLGRRSAQMLLGRQLASRLGVDGPLPEQGYYNPGQRGLALFMVCMGTLAACSGLVMAFAPQLGLMHGETVATALLVHHFSVWLAAAGLPIHIYMAALVREERPALRSMICGTVPAAYARAHHPHWNWQAGEGQ